MSGYILDTHAWLWAISQPKKCSSRVRRIIEDPSNTLYLSMASAWEIAVKTSLGKLKVPKVTTLDISITRINAESGVNILGITLADVAEVGNLAWNHRDPFDRMLIAQALNNDLTIISNDEQLQKYGVNVIW